MSWFFALGGQSTGVSASASVLPMNTQDWFPLGWTGWISLESKALSRVLSNQIRSDQSLSHVRFFATPWITVQKLQFFTAQLYLWPNSHPCMTIGKTISLTRWNFVGKVMSLIFNMLLRLIIAFLPRSKHLLISWLQSVILDSPKVKSVTVSIFSPYICHEVMGPDAMILVFLECWVLIQLFHSSLLPSSRGSLVPLHFLR